MTNKSDTPDNTKKPAIPSFRSLADLQPKSGGNRKAIPQSSKAAKRKGGKKSAAKKTIHSKDTLAAIALNEGRVVEAKQLYDAYFASHKDSDADAAVQAIAYSNRGIAYSYLGDINSAIKDFERAVELDHTYAVGYSNLANAYLKTQQFDQANEAIQQSLRLDPDYYTANYNHFIILNKLKQYSDAVAKIDTLFAKFPQQVAKIDPSPFIDVKKQTCDWEGIETLERRTVDLLVKGDFTAKWALVHLNNHALDGEQQRKVLSLYSQQNYGHLTRADIAPYDQTSRKIRIAYVSSDFHDHATTRLMADLFEQHSHDKFEWYAISHSINDNSAMRVRVKNSFDHFIEVSDWTDAQVGIWMREQQIDIAIDLKGHTGLNRLGIFARGCAPIQMTYIGFPGTTGSSFMDYIIGDKWVTPQTSQAQFSEAICQLPHCYQPNDSKRYLPPEACADVNDSEYQHWRRQQRLKEELPEDALVLCCFNNTYKLHPSVFNVWMSALRQHPKAVLWLLADKPLTQTHLHQYAAKQGIDSNRIIFAPRIAQEAYLTRYLLADLFVDTLAYNAHTTGSDALWMGLPLLTCAGNSFASRVGASLLDTVGLPELITHSLEEYADKIDMLCSHPNKLKDYSQHLRDVRSSTPLFDTKLMAQDLETLYLGVLNKDS